MSVKDVIYTREFEGTIVEVEAVIDGRKFESDVHNKVRRYLRYIGFTPKEAAEYCRAIRVPQNAK